MESKKKEKVSEGRRLLNRIVTEPYSQMTNGQWWWIAQFFAHTGYKYQAEEKRLWRKRYERSECWKEFRDWYLAKCESNCRRCMTKDIITPASCVDHLNYEHLGNERPEDIQALCKGCHYVVSRQRGQV